MSLIGSWYDEKKFKLALPRENGNLPFLMMMYVVIMEGFVDVSTAHYDKDSNNSLSYQNLTKFDTVN